MPQPPHSASRCPACDGWLQAGIATVSTDGGVTVVRGVPAEICASCHEPFLDGAVVERVMRLLKSIRASRAEASVVWYPGCEADDLPAGEDHTATAA